MTDKNSKILKMEGSNSEMSDKSKDVDEVIRRHRNLLLNQLKSLSGILETHSNLQEMNVNGDNKLNESAFFNKRRRLLSHLKQKKVIDINTGLTDVELIVRACIDRKGRISSPPMLERFTQAMWESRNVEDWSLLLSVLESSKKSKPCLEAFVDMGGCQVLRSWMVMIIDIGRTEKECAVEISRKLLKVMKILPVTYGSFLQMRKFDMLDMLRGTKGEPYFGDNDVQTMVSELRYRWSKLEIESGDDWIYIMKMMRITSTENIENEQKAIREAKEREDAIQAAKEAETFKKRPAQLMSYSSATADILSAMPRVTPFSPPRGRGKNPMGKVIPFYKKPQPALGDLGSDSFIPDDVDPVMVKEMDFENLTEEEKVLKLKSLNFDQDDEMDVDQFAVEPMPLPTAKKRKKSKLKWADQVQKPLREVREFRMEESPSQVLQSTAKEQLEHHEPTQWKALVKSEREDERSHIGQVVQSKHSQRHPLPVESTVKLLEPEMKMKPVIRFYRPRPLPVSDDEDVRPKTAEFIQRIDQCRGRLEEFYISVKDIPPTPSEVGVLRIPSNPTLPIPSISLLTAEEDVEDDAMEDSRDNNLVPISVVPLLAGGMYDQPPPPPPPMLRETPPVQHQQSYEGANRDMYDYNVQQSMNVSSMPIQQYDMPPQQQPIYQTQQPQYSNMPLQEPQYGLPPQTGYEPTFQDTSYQHSLYGEERFGQPRMLDDRDQYFSSQQHDRGQDVYTHQRSYPSREDIVPTAARPNAPLCKYWNKKERLCREGSSCTFKHDTNSEPVLPPWRETKPSSKGLDSRWESRSGPKSGGRGRGKKGGYKEGGGRGKGRARESRAHNREKGYK